MFLCVAYHCASEFLTTDGLNFNLAGCSAACERAAIVAVWASTNGLATFPVIGGVVGGWTAWAEDIFSGRGNFLMTMILLDAVAGHRYPYTKPNTLFATLLYKVTGVQQSVYADADEDEDEDEEPEKTWPLDLSDNNMHTVAAVATVAGISWAWNNGMAMPNIDFVKGGLFSSVTSDDKNLHAHWPFSLMLTLHVLNSVKSQGGYWAADIVACAFSAFGGLMMRDLLNGDLTMPVLFGNNEGYLTLLMLCWYIRNHNLPFTDVNLWKTISFNVKKVIPLGTVMDLCTLAFNCSLLISTAMATKSATNFLHLPAICYTTFLCVAYHCAGDFLATDGLSFSLTAGSQACERAVWVAFWCATNGLGAFPFVGGPLSTVTGAVEGFFGGRAEFLMTAILFDALFGNLLPFDSPHLYAMRLAYMLTGISDGEEEAAEDEDDEDDEGYLSDPNVKMVATLTLVAAFSFTLQHQSMALSPGGVVSFVTDGGLFSSVTSDDKVLHAKFWPFSLMLTLHVLNSVKSQGGYWAADIVACAFSAFGGLMMRDLLNGDLTMPVLFDNNEGYLTLLMLCWYIRNYDLPYTQLNLWTVISSNANKYVPLAAVMDLCTLAFNCSLLISTAMATKSATNFLHLPVVCSTVFLCVAYHCAGEFFSPRGIGFFLDGCSVACERAVWVAFWCATNGLADVPFIGGVLGGFGGALEASFGGRANLLMTSILLDAVAGHLLPFERPHSVFAKALYRLTGIDSSED